MLSEEANGAERDRSMTTRAARSGWAVVAIVLLALVLRIGMTSAFVGLGTPPKEAAGGLDVVDYEGFAWRMVEGHGYVLADGTPTARRSPGTSFSLVPVYALFGRSYTTAHLWFCLLSALTCAGTVWLARMVTSREAAALAGLWLALYPGHAYVSMHFFSEVPLGLALVLACATTLLSLERGRVGWAVAAGVLWGAVVLIRPNNLAALPLGLGWLLLLPVCRTRATVRQLAVVVAAAALTVLPWVARNATVMGKPTIATLVGGYTFWGANNEIVLRDPRLRGGWIFGHELVDEAHPLQGDEVARERAAWGYGLGFVRAHLGDMPGLVAARLWRLVTPFEATPNKPVYYTFALAWLLTAPFVFVGGFWLFRDQRRAAAVLFTPILATVAVAVVFYGSIRFRDSVASLFVILAASGLVRALASVGGRSFGRSR
jgi:4-amino-4-deoxy-L-arabinose transferase-like glycosyltransferase